MDPGRELLVRAAASYSATVDDAFSAMLETEHAHAFLLLDARIFRHDTGNRSFGDGFIYTGPISPRILTLANRQVGSIGARGRRTN